MQIAQKWPIIALFQRYLFDVNGLKIVFSAEKENFKKLELELAEVKTAKAATCETVARYKEQLDTLTREAVSIFPVKNYAIMLVN